MRIALAILLFPFCCLAQFNFFDQAFLGQGIVTNAPDNGFANLAYRWVASDLATNTAISGNWTDRIQGVSWVQGAASLQPTNAATGIWFDSGHYLTNAGLTTVDAAHTNLAFGFIIDVKNCQTGIHPSLLGNTVQYGLDDQSCNNWLAPSVGGNPLGMEADATFYALSSAPFSSTNQFIDLICVQVFTNSGPSVAFEAYTNGVFSGRQVRASGTGAWAWGLGRPPNIIPLNWPRSSAWMFRLKELLVWTNSNTFPSNTLWAFHNYATNTYGFSP